MTRCCSRVVYNERIRTSNRWLEKLRLRLALNFLLLKLYIGEWWLYLNDILASKSQQPVTFVTTYKDLVETQ